MPQDKLVSSSRLLLNAWGVDLRGRGLELRRLYLRPKQKGTVAPSRELSSDKGKYGTAFRLHVLLMWLAGSPGHQDMTPHTTTKSLDHLATAVGLGSELPRERRRQVRSALRQVGALKLIKWEEAGALDVTVQLRDERGVNRPYRPPGASTGKPEHAYQKFPKELFTNGWFSALHPTTLWTYMIMVNETSRQNRFANWQYRQDHWSGLGDTAYENGKRILRHYGLITVETQKHTKGSRDTFEAVADGLEVNAPAAPIPYRVAAKDLGSLPKAR